MAIEMWSLLLQIVIGVLIVGYGIWLRHIVGQQLKMKDSTIQSLDAAIKSKEAEIAALKSDTAPAITKAYAQMKQHANDMTEESLRLSEQVKT